MHKAHPLEFVNTFLGAVSGSAVNGHQVAALGKPASYFLHAGFEPAIVGRHAPRAYQSDAQTSTLRNCFHHFYPHELCSCC